MTSVRLKPAALRSRVKHSNTESLRSLGHIWSQTETIIQVFQQSLILSFNLAMKKGISDRMAESSELNQTKLKLGSSHIIKSNEIPPDSTRIVMHR